MIIADRSDQIAGFRLVLGYVISRFLRPEFHLPPIQIEGGRCFTLLDSCLFQSGQPNEDLQFVSENLRRVFVREIVHLGQLRDARLERAFYRISCKIISTGPTPQFEQNLRIDKMLLRKLLKQLAIEPDDRPPSLPGNRRSRTTATAPNRAPSRTNRHCSCRSISRPCPQKSG